ncbi:TonB-dependent receptor [Sphingopyxis indica]|uniref:Protein TonB, links inner and outer membranes n=1 Tax=Sphingopyxis indica TaxID=436663 RepID=A0A239LH50_9SPHN|nr:TonB-dependent receptor [Sphingopyxis indica]SNT29620.1 protein TonB, links inner and outer membranes [Sphingopyxis indica]
MAAATLMPPGGPSGSRRRKPSPFTFGRILAVVGVGLVLVIGYAFMGKQTVSDRPNEMKTTTVILPPPPLPSPPEPEVVEQPPEPTIAPPIEQPMDTPPPPDASNDPVQGDNALTAREGAGPSNYGLQSGDGSGTRIGGRPGGGDAFAAYANVALNGIRAAAQGDRELSRGRYSVQLAVTVGPDGRITNVRVIGGGDDRRNARLREVLTGLQLSQRPPAGLPVMRIELNARSGA